MSSNGLNQQSSFISKSTLIYGKINDSLTEERNILQDAQERVSLSKSPEEKNRIETDAEQKTATKCLLSLTTPADTDRSLDWIHVQTSNDLRRAYILDEFVRYITSCDLNVPDPTRTLLNLNHMRKRAFYIRGLPDDVRDITTVQLTDVFIDEKFKALITGWAQGYRSVDIPEFYAGIFMNISVWDRSGFIHDIDVAKSQEILMKRTVGTWLMRKSSKSTVSEFRTVFTISYRTRAHTNSIRVMLLHGVGVYSLTCEFMEMPSIYLNDAELNETRFDKMISLLGYREPHFACITEMLDHCSQQGMIVLGSYVTVDSLRQTDV